MQVSQLIEYLDDPAAARDWLRDLGVEDARRAHGNLVRLAETSMTLDLLALICEQLARELPKNSDPDRALNNLERFFAAARSPLSLGGLFERDRDALPVLLQIFATSQYLSDHLVRDPESYDLLRLTEGQPVARQVLVDEVASEVEALDDRRAVLATLRRYKHRETLRIAYGDIVGGQRIETVTRQISYVADALCEAALRFASRELESRRGVPRLPGGRRCRFVVLGLGKLGGVELNYSSDIDLVLLYEGDGRTDGERPIDNIEFFDRLAQGFIKLLTEPTDLGTSYRVDLRLRPDACQGSAVISVEAALRYYDVSGRTWERQAFVKSRPVAGDLELGQQFLRDLEPWIYRRYLSRADITGIKALKRRIEARAAREGGDERNVKTGRGGIRDVEFVIQFLQLLNGAELEEVRAGNTLDAIARLEQGQCLTMQERSILTDGYSFLRKIEHRLQVMFDLQTHMLPEDDAELRRLAIRMGYADSPPGAALAAFKRELAEKTRLNRKILDHLLHDAFGEQEQTEPEVDLVLDPDPPPRFIGEVLSRHGLRDPQGGYRNLAALASEKIPFLSTRRCRHFLAAIAPELLKAIATTPDPDFTLVNLSKVSDSLGGKGVLWELFSFQPACLDLYVRLCAASPYLSEILTSSPGMIDELMDSLVLDRLPRLEGLTATLAELCRGAEDIDPILHSFKSSQHLRVGVRDILGKEDVRETNRALSDIAEVCLAEISRREFSRLAEKFGRPAIKDGPEGGGPCDLIVLAMGKMGGREPNYHSDLDLVFLFDADGTTLHRRPEKGTTNQHFFGQLGQRIIKSLTGMGPFGRLYEADPRLRPTGKSGALAVSLAEFSRYFEEGDGQLWERQALCKARPVYGNADSRDAAMRAVRRAIVCRPWRPENAADIRHMRGRLEETAGKRNLKRGTGGTVDIEFAVQTLQLKHAVEHPGVLTPGTFDALDALHAAGAIGADDHGYLSESYRFLRSVEARLRLMNTTARHDMPESEEELKKLAYLLGYADHQSLAADAERYTQENRRRFERIMEEAATPSGPASSPGHPTTGR